MKDAARFVLGLLLAVAIHTFASRAFGGFPTAVDLFLLLSIYHSLGRSPVGSALGGSLAGLLADALSGGYFGLYGFSNTLAAWATAQLQQRVVLHQPMTVGLLMSAATALQMTTLALLHTFLLQGSEAPSPQIMLTRMLTSGILGFVLYVATRRLRQIEHQWRERRGRRLRIES